MNSEAISAVERRGRNWGGLIFLVLITVPTLTWASQVIRQAFDAPNADGLDCETGLTELLAGLDRARASATPAPNEDEALAAFRASLGPAWASPRRVRAACQGNPSRLAEFGKIERLRYAEEHAVRYETRGLSADRIAVEKIRRELAPKPAR